MNAELPELIVDITGIVKSSNLDAFKSHAMSVFESINTDLQTDEDFAEAEDTIKWCGIVETKLETAKNKVLAQTESIDALYSAVDELEEQCRQKRLTLARLVKTRKDSLRAELVTTAKTTVIQYIDALNYGHYILPTLQDMIDFSAAIKSKKTFASCREAIARHMETLKLAANDANNNVAANMAYIERNHAKHKFMFHDLNTLTLKNADDFITAVELQVSRYNEAQTKAEAAATETVKAKPIQPVELSVTELEEMLDTEITQQPAQPKTLDEFVEAGNFGDMAHIVWCFLDYYQTLKSEGLNPQHIINNFNGN